MTILMVEGQFKLAIGKHVMAILSRVGSLQRFVVCMAFVSILGPALIGGAFVIQKNHQKTIANDSMVTAENYGDLLKVGLSAALWNISPSLGAPLIESVSVDPSVMKITVLDESDSLFLSYENNQIINSSGALEKSPTISIEQPILYGGERIGSVQLEYSLRQAYENVRREAKLLITVIVFQLLISLAVLGRVLSRRVFRPLNALVTSAQRIATGDLKTPVPLFANDEFGDLSRKLDVMREAMESQVTNLEQRVIDRTSELSSLNDSLYDALAQLQRAQSTLVQSEKLAALGSVVAGVAHELNTPIGNGLTVATSLRESVRKIHKSSKEGITRADFNSFVQSIEDGSYLVERNLETASELVKSFKQTSIDQTSAKRRKFNLRTLMNETVITLSPALKKTPFQVCIEGDGNIELDSFPGPLGQVITNLINNAVIHAFEDRLHGVVTINFNQTHSGQVIIIISDDGHGISEENLKKIFDPFFTTKLGAGGSGMGMHIVHNIVTAVLGGNILVESHRGQGTSFAIDIPMTAPQELELSVQEELKDQKQRKEAS